MNGNLAERASCEAPTVFVVDDDEDMRDSLGQLLRSVGMQANIYSYGEALIEALTNGPVSKGPACIVLDVRLKGLSGLMVQQELSRRSVPHPVIFITGHGDIVMTVKAMKAGAVDFLTKPLRDQDLLEAIAEAVEQDRLRLCNASALQDLRDCWLALTPRQKQVMQCLARGMPVSHIADELGVSEITVKIYRGESMKRLGARTLTEFFQKAKLLGLEVVSASPLQG